MRRPAVLLAALAVVAVVCASAWTQDYRVGPGDVLEIWVFDEDELSRSYQVGPDGAIDFPLIGSLPVNGLTVGEIKQSLTERLSADFLVNPQIGVQIKEFNSQKVYVLGAVAKPGFYEIRGETTILELIGRAGGVTEHGGHNFLLVRGGQLGAQAEPTDQPPIAAVEPIIIDSTKLIDEGDISLNYVMENGDILYVPKGEEVFVYGEVKTPGRVVWSDDLTALRAVSLAGGPTQLAATKRVQIIRSGDGPVQKFVINLHDISKGKDPDFPLIPNDVVVVPRSVL